MRSTTVAVGPFDVSALPTPALIEAISDLGASSSTVTTAFALHVGGLAERHNEDLLSAYGKANIVYADGTSISVVSWFTTGVWLERSATTDIGFPILVSSAEKLGRPVRVALVGGPAGLSRAAADKLSEHPQVAVVFATHGFHASWEAVISELNACGSDVVVVGMGCPHEMLWIQRHRELLPPALYLTCGGWFGFMTGQERRAPVILQRMGLEWLFRVAQDRRKLGRYARGLGHVVMTIRDSRRRRRRLEQRC